MQGCRLEIVLVALFAVGCGDGAAGGGGETDGETEAPGSSSGTAPGTTSSSTAPGTGVTTETPGTESGSSESSGSTGDPEPSFCDEQGLPVAALPDEAGVGWGEVAGDFAIESTFGPWVLSENFTGCDSYIFINDQGSTTATALRNTAATELFERSAPNTHYFFLTTSGDAQAGAEAWEATIGGTLGGLDEAGQEHWAQRVHFVTAYDGALAAFLAEHPDQVAFGLDRAHTWDDPGSLSDTTTGAFATSMPVLGYVSRYYNFRYAQDLDLAAQDDVTEVLVLDHEDFLPECDASCFGLPNGPFSNDNNWSIWPAEFPAAGEMAQFDSLEMVVTASCGPSPDADCGHWDYEALINLCDSDACDGVVTEVARWITPYSRPGTRRWVIEASPLLGLVADGGTHHFQFGMIWNMNPSNWDIRFRLRNTGREEASREVVPAFMGNRGFNDDYNTWETVEFTPPEGTTKVEFVAILSGHGQDAGNCAEWCEHQHDFTVNGRTTYRREFPGEVEAQRCAEAVDEGVVPGQWGNWTPGRAGWCPGLPVQPWVVDITDDVTIGELNTLDYTGLFNNAPVTGNRGRIRLSSYLAFSE